MDASHESPKEVTHFCSQAGKMRSRILTMTAEPTTPITTTHIIRKKRGSDSELKRFRCSLASSTQRHTACREGGHGDARKNSALAEHQQSSGAREMAPHSVPNRTTLLLWAAFPSGCDALAPPQTRSRIWRRTAGRGPSSGESLGASLELPPPPGWSPCASGGTGW